MKKRLLCLVTVAALMTALVPAGMGVEAGQPLEEPVSAAAETETCLPCEAAARAAAEAAGGKHPIAFTVSGGDRFVFSDVRSEELARIFRLASGQGTNETSVTLLHLAPDATMEVELGMGSFWSVSCYRLAGDQATPAGFLNTEGEKTVFALADFEEGLDQPLAEGEMGLYQISSSEGSWWVMFDGDTTVPADTPMSDALAQGEDPFTLSQYQEVQAGNPIPVSGIAYASTQTVDVDGKGVVFQMYALKDENGNETNYVKLRDLAHVLRGSQAQFAVEYDGTVGIVSGGKYADNGSEMTTPFTGDRSYLGGSQTVMVDGRECQITAITLQDDQGGGYNYFKLRDIGFFLDFFVGWDAQRGVYIDSDEPNCRECTFKSEGL